MNNVNVIGRLVRDPELRHTPAGVSVASMRIAVDRAGQRDDAGNTKAGFFDVTAWKDLGENCAQYLTKGREVGVSGRLSHREWEAQDGTKRSAVEIVAYDVKFIGPRPEGETGGAGGDSGGDNRFVPAAATSGGGGDDDIPF